jgi:small conductance mechanosensitive channel
VCAGIINGQEAEMEEQLANLNQMTGFVLQYGQDIILALLILVVGLILANLLRKLIRHALEKMTTNRTLISIVTHSLYVLILLLVVSAALQQAGMDTLVIRRIFVGVTLAVVTLIIIFRPYLPTLPYKVGNTIKTGDLLGKVEATSLINTKIRTFDGKTIFVPNSRILNDYFINYHVTPDRRLKVDVGIRYDQDLVKAKQILEILMISDPRVLSNPRPAVWVMNLEDSYVKLGARAWVENLKYCKTRCELIEKVKLRFDFEGIQFAFPQRDVHLYYEADPFSQPDDTGRKMRETA